MSSNSEPLPLSWSLAIFLLAIGLLFFLHSCKSDGCTAKGGHLVSVDRSWICVSSDGRIL